MNSMHAIPAKKTSKRLSTFRRLGFLKSGNRHPKILRLFWILCGIIYLATGLTTAPGAEVSDLMVNNSQDHLHLSVKIRDVIGREVNASVDAEVSATVVFSIALYEVKPFWFDKKIAHQTATNTLKYDPTKKEYSLMRSWDSGQPLVVGALN